jgi:hypothetical protein
MLDPAAGQQTAFAQPTGPGPHQAPGLVVVALVSHQDVPDVLWVVEQVRVASQPAAGHRTGVLPATLEESQPVPQVGRNVADERSGPRSRPDRLARLSQRGQARARICEARSVA